jgi:hypothetical protein
MYFIMVDAEFTSDSASDKAVFVFGSCAIYLFKNYPYNMALFR